jgi:SAM-dependent methyltransferase
MKCRNCGASLELVLIDLGSAPLSNAYLTAITLRRPEKWFPLRVLVCESCWLVQAEAYSRAAEIFNEDYAYFSSFSDAWMTHAKQYVDDVTAEFKLTQSSFVVEVASNDGYLLKNFVYARIPCLGVEPTASTAAAARAKGVDTLERFFGEELATEIVQTSGHADLLVANNVLAHVPEPHDFLDGVSLLLTHSGVATFEFPHLINLIEQNQFDTIYHEHFAYLSFTATVDLMARSGLNVFRVQELPTHGGSLRVFAQPAERGSRDVEPSVDELLHRERDAKMLSPDFYCGFQDNANQVKNRFLAFLLDAAASGQTVAGYGAAAKGNTLLNFAGVGTDLIQFVVDRNPAKQGKFLPGSRIPIVHESKLAETRPDYIIIFPWNLKGEVTEQLAYARSWGARFVTAVPELGIT